MSKEFFLLAILLFAFSCSEKKEILPESELEAKMNNIAEKYVKLVLKIGQYDNDFVDAYYGPKEWMPQEKNLNMDSTSFNELKSISANLLDELESLKNFKATELETLRYRYLYKQTLACQAKIYMLNGVVFPFTEEAKALYDADVPEYSSEYFQNTINELDKILPGNGSVALRLQDFKSKFIVPENKLEVVFNAAIEECRKRTLENIKLPEQESFTIEYVDEKPWGAYNWYKGNYHSVIQVNTDLPIYIDRANDLAGHEGYPGHHVYNALLEYNLVKKRNWIEFTVYALFSPQSLIAEGTANYGVEVAFPEKERIKFEKEVLFPLAGLNPDEAELYYKVLELQQNFSYAGNEAARNYLDGNWSEEKTIEWLTQFGLRSNESAAKYLSFINQYRSYVINYNRGMDIVKNYVEKNGGTENNPKKRWELFQYLLSTPQTPSGLIEE